MWIQYVPDPQHCQERALFLVIDFLVQIPVSTIMRLILLPHKDQRQMFFCVNLDPPIKQGQTRSVIAAAQRIGEQNNQSLTTQTNSVCCDIYR